MDFLTPQRSTSQGGLPLLNDDQFLNNPAGTEFLGAPSGLDLQGAPQGALGLGDMSGLNAQLESTLAGIRSFGQGPTPLTTPRAGAATSSIFYSPSTGDIVVNGYRFNERNASQALASEEAANQPARQFTLPDTATDWRPMPREEYDNYIDTIRNPTFGRRIDEAWEHAWRGMADIGVGAVLAGDNLLTGDEDNQWALRQRENILQAYEENAPFMMQMRDVSSPEDAAVYTSQMLVQGVPWLIETIASMAAGALIGGAVGSGQALVAKEGLRRAAMQAIRGRLTNGARAYRAAMEEAGGRVLTRQEAVEAVARAGGVTDDLETFYDFSELAYQTTRNAGRGATAASVLSSYATGVGDIRNTIADAGGDTESAEAMANIFGFALPYAATETLGDLILTAPVARLFPDMVTGATRRGNIVRGAGVNFASEGAQEVAQLGIAEQAAANVTGEPIDLEPIDLLEAGVGGGLGGAGVGGAIGALTPGVPRSQRNTPTPPTTETPPVEPAPSPAPTGTPPVNPYAGGMAIDVPGPEGMSPGVSLGNIPEPTPVQPEYNSPYDVEYPGALNQEELIPGTPSVPRPPGWPNPAPEVNSNITPELASYDALPGQRTPAQIVQAISAGQDITPEERQTLREAVTHLAETNPDQPGYQEVLRQLNAPAQQASDQDVLRRITSAVLASPAAPAWRAIRSDMQRGLPVQASHLNKVTTLLESNDFVGSLPPELQGWASETSESIKQHVAAHNEAMASRPRNVSLSPDAPGIRAAPLAPATGQDGLRGRTGATRNERRKKAKVRRAEERKNTPAFTNKDNLNREMFYGGRKAIEATEKSQAEEVSRLRSELQKANKLQLKTLQSKIAKLEEQLKEQRDAIPERGPAQEAVRDEPRPSQKDGSRDTGRREAPREEAQQENDEGVSGVPELSERETAALAALRYVGKKEGKDIREKAAGVAGVMTKGHKPSRERSGWVYTVTPMLTKAEVVNIIKTLDAERGTPEKRRLTRAQREKEERVIHRFHQDVLDAWKQNRSDPKHFESFVLSNPAEIVQWVESRFAKEKAGIRTAVRAILREQPQLAAIGTYKRTKLKTDFGVIFVNPTLDDLRFLTRRKLGRPEIEWDMFRYILDKNGNVFAATAYDMTHDDIVFHARREGFVAEGYSEHMGDRYTHGVITGYIQRVGDTFPGWPIDANLPKAAATTSEENLLDAIEEMYGEQETLPKNWYQEVSAKYRKQLGDHRRVRSLGRQTLLNSHLIKGHEAGLDLLGKHYTKTYAPHKVKRYKDAPKQTSDERTGISIRRAVTLGGAAKVALKEAKRIVTGVQARMHEHNRFNTVHAYKNLQDVFADAGNITLRIGAQDVTLERFLTAQGAMVRRQAMDKFGEDTDLDVGKWWMESYFGRARAGIIPSYNALFVFSDRFQSERELTAALEHEYVVHRGLAAIFPDPAERQQFLQRALLIPGMRDKVREHIAKFPLYANIPILDQVEEVIASHAEVGPLALERLLSAKEAIDQDTRRTLWEDLVRLVTDWIDRVFNGRTTENREGKPDAALDRIVAALREHAIMGQTGDMHALLDEMGVSRDTYSAALGRDTLNDPKLSAAVPSATETAEKLYGGGRPYRPDPWHKQVGRTIMSNEDLINKARDLAEKNVGSAIKEKWKEIGRNIEAMNNMAQRSVLVKKMMDIMHATIYTARFIMTEIQEMRPYAAKSAATARVRQLWGDKAPGSTEKQRNSYGTLAIVATNNRLPLATEEVVRNTPRIRIQQPDGTYAINEEAVAKLIKLGTLTKEEFEAGVPQYVVTGDGTPTEVSVEKLPQDVINSGYDIYEQETKVMADSMVTVLKNADIMLSKKNDAVVSTIMNSVKFKPADQEFINEALQRLKQLYVDIAFHNYVGSNRTERHNQQEKAREVVTELMRTMHENEKVKDWLDPNRTAKTASKSPRRNNAFKWREQVDPAADVKPFTKQIAWFLGEDAATATPRLARLNTLGVKPQEQYDMLTPFQGLLNAEVIVREYENDTIQSILGNYVEFTRKGKWRVYLDVLDSKGEPADISAEFKAVLPVIYTKSKREAEAKQAELMEELKGEHEVLDASGQPITIKFDVGVGDAPGVRTLSEAPKIKEFVRVAELVKLKLNAGVMKRIGDLLEHASERKRFGLQRAGTPGMDGDILENNNTTMTQRAWRAAKMAEASNIDEIFRDSRNITGDWGLLETLQQNFDKANNAPVRNEQAVFLAERALLRYANQLRYMAKTTTTRPTVNIRTTKGEVKLKIEPEAEAHRSHAIALKDSLERDELELNLNDLLSKTGPLRYMSVVLQLGSVAAGIMNAFTVITHLPHVLTAFHKKTGYGEGFSYTEVTAAIIAAANDTGIRGLRTMDVGILKNLLDEAEKGNNKTNMDIEELRAMYRMTLKGLLMPQQTYSLTGGTESNISNLLIRNLSEALLLPFGGIEAMNRRITALTTYRLAKQRYIDAGIAEDKLNDPDSLEYAQLMQDIEYVVNNSQGDYANINRPKIFRGDIAQYIMQYKMFPLITMHMIYNLPAKQQLAVLAVLFFLGGLKGEPFADDFADIYDTLLQKMGFKHDSVELQLVQALEEIMPGSSRWVMHGWIDSIAFGGTLSSRISMGDILPLTGILRPEADIGRELMNAIGPAFSGNVDALEFAFTAASGTAQILGLRERTMTWGDFIRAIPQAQLRGIGEGALMASTGEITDPRGRLTSDEVTFMSIAMRMLGFYPLEATRANNAVRLDRMHTGYMRNIRARYILSYANAYRRNDQDMMDRILRYVQDWNDRARETGQDDMLIRNFRQAATRAGRAASQTTIERTSDSAPNYSLIDELAEITLADTEADD